MRDNFVSLYSANTCVMNSNMASSFLKAILLQGMIASVSPRSEEGVSGLDLTTGLAEGGDNRN